MTVTVDFSNKGADPVLELQADLTETTPNEVYELSDEPVPGSIQVILDGRDLHPDADNGYTFTAPSTITLKKPKRANHFLMVRYLKK